MIQKRATQSHFEIVSEPLVIADRCATPREQSG
jgi:hypothetical protein